MALNSSTTHILQVACRTCDFGAGSDLEAVAVMTGTLRWTSWAPNVFCTQLLVAALTCVAQSSAKDDHESSFSLWRAFVVGRVSFSASHCEYQYSLPPTHDP
jgi:hypothetical protein